MLHGNIANREAPKIAFNIDTLLFQEAKGRNFLERIVDRFKSDSALYFEREINRNFVSLVDTVWTSYPYSIYFISFRLSINHSEELHTMLLDYMIPYTNIDLVHNVYEVRDLLERGFYSLFFCNNPDIISICGKNAHNIANWREVLG